MGSYAARRRKLALGETDDLASTGSYLDSSGNPKVGKLFPLQLDLSPKPAWAA